MRGNKHQDQEVRAPNAETMLNKHVFRECLKLYQIVAVS
jgi:hypothetical protein